MATADHVESIEEVEVQVIDEREEAGGKAEVRLIADHGPAGDFKEEDERRGDSLDLEAAPAFAHCANKSGTRLDWGNVLRLAFQSIGVVYGDIGTSPLYVFAAIFPGGIRHEDDVLGALSLILYTITVISLVKYVFIVLRATDGGNGGTFALYSLICRHIKLGILPNYEVPISCSIQLPYPASKLKEALESSTVAKYLLLTITMFCTCMVIGDGVFTPCISVLSAVGGIKEAADGMTQDRIVMISIAILVLLFLAQRLGTNKVGYTFAPIITLWFLLIAGIGAYNLIKYDPLVFRAVNPMYIVSYFRRNGKSAWISLGGTALCITGVEALFADVGHFTVQSIQIGMCLVVYPSLMLAYAGQASYLRKNMRDVSETFYKSIPVTLYWPMFIVAILASAIASQAMISATFSIIQQSLALGCFPPVKVIHTSSKYKGQVYIPEVNYALMLACVATTASFRDTTKISNAYGIAVLLVMTLTSSLLVLVMIMIWKTRTGLVIIYIVFIGSMELTYLSSVLYKFNEGGYLPLTFAVILIVVMLVWNYVHLKRYTYELLNMVSPTKLEELTRVQRIPGIAIFYSELLQGIPPIFEHYVKSVAALHTVLIFVSIKPSAISTEPSQEQFLFQRLGSPNSLVFQCVVRCGYKEMEKEQEPFEVLLMQKLKEFIKEEAWRPDTGHDWDEGEGERTLMRKETEEELALIDKELKIGVVHLVAESKVVAGKGSGLWKRLVIDYAYNCLRRNTRQEAEVFTVPHRQLIKVGMMIEL